jgi:hypothetical protein
VRLKDVTLSYRNARLDTADVTKLGALLIPPCHAELAFVARLGAVVERGFEVEQVDPGQAQCREKHARAKAQEKWRRPHRP